MAHCGIDRAHSFDVNLPQQISNKKTGAVDFFLREP
jgi:hypothetical protein